MVYSDDFGHGTLTHYRSNEVSHVTVINRRVDSSANEDLDPAQAGEGATPRLAEQTMS
jgi:hypothetical protein